MRRDLLPPTDFPLGTPVRHALDRVQAFDADPQARATTADRFRWLAKVTGEDAAIGKLFESHLDAVGIAREILGDGAAAALVRAVDPSQGLWGVWAAGGPAGAELQLAAGPDGGLVVSGRKCWCSGASGVSAALATARDADGQVQLIAVSMHHPRVTVTREGWDAVGMADTASVDVLFDTVPAWPVGAPGAYLDRPGFWHGAAGIAACWHGAAAAVAQRLRERVQQRGAAADDLLAAHLGAVDCALSASALALRHAAAAIDAHRAGGPPFGRREALQVRGTVEAAASTTLDHVGRALGAGPLCRDADHAQRVADLAVFLRQSHAEWDLAVLGRLAAQANETLPGDNAWTL